MAGISLISAKKMQPTIREYHASDKPHLLAILRLNIPKYFFEAELDDLSRYLDEAVEMYYVVEVDHEIIGAGGINFDDDHTGVISWDYLHPAFHGKGIGRELLQYRLDILCDMPNIKKIRVRTSQFTHGFYAKSGFVLKEMKNDYWAPGFDLYLMEIQLSQ